MFQSIILQTQPQGGSSFMFPLLMLGMIAVMYLFMIRPQQKKAKEAQKFASSINTGEKIVTTSGMHGRVVRTNEDNTVVIEIGRNVEITIERQAISMELTQAFHKRAGITSTAPTNNA